MLKKLKDRSTAALTVVNKVVDPYVQLSQQQLQRLMVALFSEYQKRFPEAAAKRLSKINDLSIEGKQKKYRDAKDWSFVTAMLILAVGAALFGLSLALSGVETAINLFSYPFEAVKYIANNGLSLAGTVTVYSLPAMLVYLARPLVDLKLAEWQLDHKKQLALTDQNAQVVEEIKEAKIVELKEEETKVVKPEQGFTNAEDLFTANPKPLTTAFANSSNPDLSTELELNLPREQSNSFEKVVAPTSPKLTSS